ncbi:uncharacterized protein LOC133860496 [Alnus glutinosa]|uniref:uncharacterized protein LOC133860496 n=1 Tax=Alnus glutinosa TaxID=3517 RepID=UPI002D766C83|nr:uncharacterized protein LOC133860496 [Alnus glutinosa]
MDANGGSWTKPEEIGMAFTTENGVCFYQKHWSIVGRQVKQTILNFLNHGIFGPLINYTYIALIPKNSNGAKQTGLSKFSLPGRLITDNILVAYEALHTMDSRMKRKTGYMAIKLDMSKAYDRVEWAFLEEIMKKLGFVERWISLLMTCVRSATYFVMVNGTPMGSISPSRGLRQGDPLSPYLFLLCAEGLSLLLLRAESEGKITGVPISFRGTKISHLFFADDSLLFCRANLMEWSSVQDLLHMYELASGQKLNSEKTSIFFSRNTPRPLNSHIASLVGSATMNSYHKYLVLLALVGRSKTQTFVGIQDQYECVPFSQDLMLSLEFLNELVLVEVKGRNEEDGLDELEEIRKF